MYVGTSKHLGKRRRGGRQPALCLMLNAVGATLLCPTKRYT